jgi:hypothetical protein
MTSLDWRMRLAFLINVSAIVLAACSTAPTNSVTDEHAIQEIAASFASAWNRHDMRALSDLCTEDADAATESDAASLAQIAEAYVP